MAYNLCCDSYRVHNVIYLLNYCNYIMFENAGVFKWEKVCLKNSYFHAKPLPV